MTLIWQKGTSWEGSDSPIPKWQLPENPHRLPWLKTHPWPPWQPWRPSCTLLPSSLLSLTPSSTIFSPPTSGMGNTDRSTLVPVALSHPERIVVRDGFHFLSFSSLPKVKPLNKKILYCQQIPANLITRSNIRGDILTCTGIDAGRCETNIVRLSLGRVVLTMLVALMLYATVREVD